MNFRYAYLVDQHPTSLLGGFFGEHTCHFRQLGLKDGAPLPAASSVVKM